MNKTLISLFVVLSVAATAQTAAYQQKKAAQLSQPSLFQNIIDGQKPDSVVYQDDNIIAFIPLSSQLPVHYLIVPKRRIPTMNDATDADSALLGKMLLVAKKIAKEKGIAETGYRIAINTNENAGQSVFHIHMHLLGGHPTGAMVDQTWRNRNNKSAHNHSEASAQNPFVKDALSKWKGMKNYTLEVAEAMPEDKYTFKPVAEENTFAYQLVHMAGNLYHLSAKLIRNVDVPIDVKAFYDRVNANKMSKKQIIEHLAQAFDYAEETIAKMTDKTLEEELDYWGGHSTKRKIVFLLNDHQTHHRGQLIVYLRLNGIKPPAYRGW
jgi:histidine triad (HIT) family protein